MDHKNSIMFGVLSYVQINSVSGNIKKMDKMTWVLAALFILRVVMKAIV